MEMERRTEQIYQLLNWKLISIIRKLVKREKTRTMSKQERRKVEVSMMNSEQKEVTNMQADNRLLEEMLSNENLNKAFLQVREKQGSRGSRWYEI